ncbi:lysine histidine transporter 1-like isoform X3 [Durio zibethinus]|uniref:Lysine histidine transporter 1-like isoform X3 n=1 Tax=Durio zibethinus TaxID=66656 RepID=A0A6P5YB15_DURZI|nr:lysine histidine transporter 1-like isoform X3 [Durio zibethinus]
MRWFLERDSTGGKSLKKIYDTANPNGKDIRTTYFIIMFGAIHFVLSHLPSFNSITFISFAAAVMSVGYSTIAWAASLHKGVQPTVNYNPRSSTSSGQVFDFFTGLGDVAFAFAGHNVVLEIQATIPSSPEKPSKKPMWLGVIVAYLVVAFCYFPVAFVGYSVFGNSVQDNVLISLEKPAWLIIAANAFVVIHVIGSYQVKLHPVFPIVNELHQQDVIWSVHNFPLFFLFVHPLQVFAMPVFDMIEAYLVKNMHFKPNLMLRIITRTSYVALTMFIGMTFPFFGGLLSFFGGFAFAPTTYYLPCIIWLAIYKPRRFSLSWYTNWICIIIGFLLMILAPIGALRQLLIQSKNFKFYS